MLLLGGVSLQGIVCSALLRPENTLDKPTICKPQDISDFREPHQSESQSTNVPSPSTKKVSIDENSMIEMSELSDRTVLIDSGQRSHLTDKKVTDAKLQEQQTVQNCPNSDICNNMESNSRPVECGIEDFEENCEDVKPQLIERHCELKSMSPNIDPCGTQEMSTQSIIHNEIFSATVSKVQDKIQPQTRSLIHLIQNVPATIGLIILSFLASAYESCVYAFLPAMAVDQGMIKTNARYLLLWAGLSDMLLVIAFSFLINIEKIRPHRTHIYFVCAAITSTIAMMLPLVKQYTLYLVMMLLFGGTMAIVYTQRIVVTEHFNGPHGPSATHRLVMALSACGHLAGRIVTGKNVFYQPTIRTVTTETNTLGHLILILQHLKTNGHSISNECL